MHWRRFIILAALFALLLVTSVVWAAPRAQTGPVQQGIFDTRADLEVLATEVFAGEARPEGWTGNFNVDAVTVVSDLWFDNELLANQLFGEGNRPDTWISATALLAPILARNVRHDLEIAADFFFQGPERPTDWRGSVPIVRCDRTLQNAVALLDEFFSLETNVPDSAFNYCRAVAADLEDELVNIYFGTQIEDQPLVDPLDLIVAVRGDLERLADERLGLGTRPPGWVGNRERASTTIIGDNFIDLQLLADALIGINQRPDGWLGGVTTLPGASYFSLRHDLELLADEALGFNTRPTGWQGLLPLARCEPITQQLIYASTVQYGFSIDGLDATAPNFCAQANSAVNLLVEAPPVLDVVDAQADEQMSRTAIAFAYLDVAATEYMGMMPDNTEFRALYRNFGESTMMFITGEDFALYIDSRWTDLPNEIFSGLPTLEGVRPIAFCNAAWCNGPSPTPTPTGGGPLVALVVGSTPVAPPSANEISITKTQVSWSNVRVTYLADNAGTRSAQVTLEVCVGAADSSAACEPVSRYFNNATGVEQPVIGQNNGLNVYDLPYGYITNVLIESETRFSTDVWISDPTIR
jgi:hypothetical protein